LLLLFCTHIQKKFKFELSTKTENKKLMKAFNEILSKEMKTRNLTIKLI